MHSSVLKFNLGACRWHIPMIDRWKAGRTQFCTMFDTATQKKYKCVKHTLSGVGLVLNTGNTAKICHK